VDRRDVRVEIRPDARFHDGSTLDADDVRATFEAVLDPALGSIHRTSLEGLRAVDVLDSKTVTFRMDGPRPTFLEALCAIGIVRAEDQMGPARALHPPFVGSGPFEILEFIPDQRVVLGRNARWWGGRARAERIRMDIVPEATVRTLAILHGDADLLQNDLPAHVVPALAKRAELRVTEKPGAVVKYLAFNLERPDLADAATRRAIATAIDRESITRYRLRGLATPADGFLRPESWAWSPLDRVVFDVDGARRVLASLGDKAPRRELVLRTSMDENANAVARILRRQLGDVGVEIRIEATEWGEFLDDINEGNFDLFTLSAVGIHDPDWHRFLFHSASIPPAGGNRARYRSAAVDSLLDLARRQWDPNVRRGLYKEALRTIARDLPVLPLWFEHNVLVERADVSGYALRQDADLSGLVTVSRRSP
jgi:peptide/nickel transport system substrate-binding protein